MTVCRKKALPLSPGVDIPDYVVRVASGEERSGKVPERDMSYESGKMIFLTAAGIKKSNVVILA